MPAELLCCPLSAPRHEYTHIHIPTFHDDCSEVEEEAHVRGIYLRTGCSCNPGACSQYCGFTLSNIK